MKNRNILFCLLVVVTLYINGCKSNVETNQTPSDMEPEPSLTQNDILINQLGYPVHAAKKALVRGPARTFEIRDFNGDSIFTGTISQPKYWAMSGDKVGVADFSALTQCGEFTLCIADVCSYPFEIGTDLYGELADAALKSYYYARVGVDIEEAFGGKWHRQAGHPDTEVFIHASAADELRPEGTTISSPGGWYDAGDYGKYIVNSNITTWTLLSKGSSCLKMPLNLVVW